MPAHTWTLNDQEYFQAPGLSFFLFHDFYPEGKQGGLQLIQHDMRVLANGDVRLANAQGQWGALPKAGTRLVDLETGTVSIPMHFPELAYNLHVRPQGEALQITIDLAEPLPASLVGKAAFNFELLPSAYWGKTFHLGQTQSIFPRQANGPLLPAADGSLALAPLAVGARLSAAPEDPLRWLSVERTDGGLLELYDGRNTAQDNWFVLRAALLPGKTTLAAELTLWANALPGWMRTPVILVSQVGYHPAQQKVAWLELDAQTSLEDEAARVDKEALVDEDGLAGEAALLRLEADGSATMAHVAQPQPWGKFLRYAYAAFDFSSVTQPGLYRVSYNGLVSAPFRIAEDIYQKDVWQPTLETFLPVQMCHMAVRDRYQLWHGACHLDDALQAPTDHEHFDSYHQGSETETAYQPYQHIPGLDRGGWHDAGDYDLAAGSQSATTYTLALCREAFDLDSDQTRVDWEGRLVILHRPDGVPDILQQVRHGVENLLGGYAAAGHSFCGIIEGSLEQYIHQGDAATMTDNRIYDPELGAQESQGERSGVRDDRWAFTNRSTALEYNVAATLAAACRVLRQHEPALAQECLRTALQVWDYEQSHPVVEFRAAYVPGSPEIQEALAVVELLLTTGEPRFSQRLGELFHLVEQHPAELGWSVTRLLPNLDPALRERLQACLRQFSQSLQVEYASTPFGLPFKPHVWGVGWHLQSIGVRLFYLTQAYPGLFDREVLFRVVHYVLGVHPASSTSLVSGVGAHSLIPAYGTNRAEFSYIPGGGASGPNLIRPDFPS
jgi:endoglucanase